MAGTVSELGMLPPLANPKTFLDPSRSCLTFFLMLSTAEEVEATFASVLISRSLEPSAPKIFAAPFSPPAKSKVLLSSPSISSFSFETRASPASKILPVIA